MLTAGSITGRRYEIVYTQILTDSRAVVIQNSSQVRAETALGTTCIGSAVVPGGEAEESPSGALDIVNIAVLRQSVSEFFVSF